jgi:excisionase family DNA binding protein
MDEVLTIEEAAAVLKVHVRTIRRMIERGDIVAAKFGRQWRISGREIDRKLRGGGDDNASEAKQ